MPLPIEEYALIGDGRTAALVGSDGGIDWLCVPRFDSASVFGALLGDESQGRWMLAPVVADGDGDGDAPDADAPDIAPPPRCTERRYLDDSVALLTRWVVDGGEIEVIDLMPTRRGSEHGDGHGHGHGDAGTPHSDHDRVDVIRRVRGVRGRVRVRQELRIRFDYAAALPWMRQIGDDAAPALVATAGPDALVVRGPAFEPVDHAHAAEFEVGEGETVDTVLTWFPAHRRPPHPLDVDAAIDATLVESRDWIAGADCGTVHPDAVRRSLLLLRALTHADTGGIVAAATTSLPEQPGGARNWDYRYVWLRDAALTLQALVARGFRDVAHHWRDWLLRAVAGDPNDLQIMYGLAGERRLPEWEVPTLPGYEGAAPVRVGNAASEQFQADVVGEVILALEQTRRAGVKEDRFSWSLQQALLGWVEQHLDEPDNGIWEIRGDPQFFVHSRVMLWAAFDAAIRAVHEAGLEGPVERWERSRDALRAEIESRGVDPATGAFRQHYATSEVDAALLVLPQVGFVAADDPRMRSTVELIERQLMPDGLVLRYRTTSGVDGLEGAESPFLACSFWLVQVYALQGRHDEASALLDRLIGFANDVGMLAEEVDATTGAHRGNTPQAFSHLSLVRAAGAVARARAGTR
ncbi:glycoside hydrolase family 15 protein [Schumannella sp. 10F1B-5-1]|uniref:glycoside hydrolase family 15 protein n=1 Tax=Schumannella sp. 10F1B-5-1 TaxID=2590780 RepID=UPI0011307BAD|nr:glycoside hydrolase family 15 protein [Schumannella sp. 10F1B-5-1]TPW73834.1 glycoside hydrolase family 15 protein [Schumannella sp. 10F1B-5-1]